MTPADALASHRAMIADSGETIAVRRYTGTGPTRTHVDTNTQARVRDYAPKDLVGPILQGDRRVIALVDTLGALLPLNPQTDKLVVRGIELAIRYVDDSTRRIQGTLIALEIQARG
jgi:hypothetical protein